MLATSLPTILNALLEVRPAGRNGFEGLAGHLLSAWTGHPIRASRSGNQFGHDGGTGSNPFSILFESKQYHASKVDLRELQGELAVAAQTYPDLDLYVIVSTQALGDSFEVPLSRQAEALGAEILMLDWEGALPPLAAFISKHSAQTVAWFAANKPSVDIPTLEAAMADVRSDSAFVVAENDVARRLGSATLGLDALRRKIADRQVAVFSDKDVARRVFGQHLAPLDPAPGVIERPTSSDAVARWWSNPGNELLTVIGDEGVGKSWTVPQWWLRTDPAHRPILLVAPSDIVRSLPVRIEGLSFIGELIAFTLADGTGVARWEGRLRRWAAGDPSRCLFLIVLDGLNEATAVRWAGLIDRVHTALAQFEGRLAVTCRRQYWRTEIADRLPRRMGRTPLDVENFSTEELQAAARARGIDLTSIPGELRNFIANPRVFSIASGLLASIRLHELTIPRLLFEFWRHRLEERGDQVVHTDADMRTIIVNHARAVRNGRPAFAVDEWRRHSSRSGRTAGPSLDDDLTEVVEGRFFEPDPAREGNYRVRRETTAFALGLLLVQDLRHAAVDELGQIVAEAIEPVGGFDQIGDVLAAAAGIAMLDASVRPEVGRVLLLRWLELQNLEEDFYAVFAAYAGERPIIYLDLIEAMHRGGRHARAIWPIAALRDASERPAVAAETRARAMSWMGWWHLGERFPLREGADEGARAAQARQEERRVDTIAATIEALSADERAVFDRACTHVDDRSLPELAATAPLLLAGQPLEDCIEGLVGWMLALEVAGRGVTGSGMTWIFDANVRDFDATSAATALAAERLASIAGCREVRNAAARLFAMSGTAAGEARCRALYELSPQMADFRSWHIHDVYCGVDPLDPASTVPENIDRAIELLAGIDRTLVRSRFGRGAEDQNVDLVTPGLARFEPSPLVAFWRAIVAAMPSREGMGIRQLAVELPGLSPLLDDGCIAAVEQVLSDLADPAHPLRSAENVFVAGHLATSTLPHLDGAQQLALLTKLPPDMPWQDDVTELLRPVAPEAFEDALRAALSGPDRRSAGPVLLFAAEGRQPLTIEASRLAGTCLADDDAWLRALVFRTAAATGDDGLLASSLASGWTARGAHAYEAHYGSQALIAAATRAGAAMPFDRLSTQSHGRAAVSGDAGDRQIWAASLGRRLDDALGRRTAQSPEARFTRQQGTSVGGHDYPSFQREPSDITVDFASLNDAEALPLRTSDDGEQLDALLAGLEDEGLASAADAAESTGFDHLAHEQPDTLRGMAARIMAADGGTFPQVASLGMSLTPALSRIDAALAAGLLARVLREPAIIRTRIGPEGTPFVLDALFAASDDAPVAALRDQVARRLPNDQVLSRYALAASRRDKGEWVRDQARGFLSGATPAEVALGLTLLGFLGPDAGDMTVLQRFVGGQGLLATAARCALRALTYDAWARNWHTSALAAPTPEMSWAAGKLMVAAADHRFTKWFSLPSPGDPCTPWSTHYRCFLKPLARRAEEVAGKRRKTLYGGDKPSAQLAPLLGFAVDEDL